MISEPEQNPFFVLDLPTDAPRATVERTGAKLLQQLAIGMKSAAEYTSPFGTHARTEALVREALAALREPSVRVGLELEASAARLGVRAEPPLSFAMQGTRRAVGWNTP